uniref:Uncharacterized protein n=1 Tax=Kwoniella pini CBS 10737 TaxID=1296096 RepID=A0A1B9ICX3_9TREE|nr:uncharacterized protein I206_00803 [Kwoniella pini CBS 10737]OCF53498.1 hypothetical protein I206_00803 [Kwoniella pini CBS 10737]
MLYIQVGIVILAVGSIIPIVHYAFLTEPFWRRVYTGGILTIGMITALRYRRKIILRTLTFLILGGSAIIPILHVILQTGFKNACEELAIQWTIIAGVLYILGTLIYASRYPERMYPGKFDIYLSSHQIFHTLVVFGIICQYIALEKTISYNNEALS